jgi:glycosyltransferase involved in cell wall biosynthesis
VTGPRTVCLVSPLPPPAGGIARWTQVVLRQADTRDDVRLLHVDTSLRWRSIHDTSWWRRLLAGFPELARVVWRTARVIFKDRPDVLHFTTSGHLGTVRDATLALLARSLGIPAVYHLRFGRVPILSSQGWEWRLLAWVMRRVNAVLVLDSATEATVQHRQPDVSVFRIPNCVEVAPRTGPNAPVHNGEGRSGTVLFVGWVTQGKGVEDLLTAWSLTAAPGWRLVLVGPFDADYVDSIAPPGARSAASTIFMGEMDHSQTVEIMAGADIVVLPSHTEGFPNALLEAMALGRAIVATPVGAIREMLEPDCGVLVPVRDPAGLATALESLIRDRDRRVQLGEKAAARATEQYAVDVVFSRYLEVWDRVATHALPQDRGHHRLAGRW